MREPPPREDTPEPDSAEVESARVLANEAKEELRPLGYSSDEIRRLADAFVAEGLEGDVHTFVQWVKRRPIA